jgi:hypothetical protein
MTVILTGIEEVMANLDIQVKRIHGKTMKGLIKAAMHIWRETQPMVPVDYGNLRASFFITSYISTTQGQAPSFKGEEAGELTTGHSNALSTGKSYSAAQGPWAPTVVLGFSAYYAWFVHENVDADFTKPKIATSGPNKGKGFRRPQAQAKFFEKGIKKATDGVAQILIAETSKP